jgi:osmotically-inducible protein OsmY
MGAILLTAALALQLACGSDPEEELLEASQAADAARERVESARKTVEARETEVKQAQERLTEARDALREAQKVVAEREQTVDRNATDAVLFRAVQKRLLEDRQLEDVAVAAKVTDGVVTLSGSVPNAKLSDRAALIASETPGVESVVNRIQVAVATPSGEAPRKK